MSLSKRLTGDASVVNPFTSDFTTDVMPYVEKHSRTIPDRAHRAIAGLSREAPGRISIESMRKHI